MELSVVIKDGFFRWPGNDNLFGPFDISIADRTIITSVGLNGSGKSTLLKIISGEFALESGAIEFPKMAEARFGWVRIKERIRFVLTHHTRFSPYSETLSQALVASARKAGLPLNVAEERKEFLLNCLKLTQYKDSEWTELSSGFRQRAAIARAFCSKPEIVILDEPFENLDVISKLEVADAIKVLNATPEYSATIVISTQDLQIAEEISDQIIVVDEGQVLFDASRREIGNMIPNAVFEVYSREGPEKIISALDKIPPVSSKIFGSRILLFYPRETPFSKILHELARPEVSALAISDLSASLRAVFLGTVGR